jgi:hypothetical protein
MSEPFNIFSDSGNPSLEALRKYLNNELSPQERQKLEEEMLDNPLAADALDGLQSVKDPAKMDAMLAAIREESAQLTNSPVVPFRSLFRSPIIRFAAAAAAVVLVLWTGILVVQEVNEAQELFTENFETFKSTDSGAELSLEDLPAESEGEITDLTTVTEDDEREARTGSAEDKPAGIIPDKKPGWMSPAPPPEIAEVRKPQKELLSESDIMEADEMGDMDFAMEEDMELEEELDALEVAPPSPMMPDDDISDITLSNTGVSSSQVYYDTPAEGNATGGVTNQSANVPAGKPLATAKEPTRIEEKPELAKRAEAEKKKTEVQQKAQKMEEEKAVVELSAVEITDNKKGDRKDKSLSIDIPNEVSPRPDPVTDEFYASSPFPDTTTQRGRQQNLMAEGLRNYNSGNYREAAGQFEEVLAFQPVNRQAQFYTGNAYLNMKQSRRAIPMLGAVAETNDSPYYESAKWYLALAYLERNNREEAKKILTEIKYEGGIYWEQAAKILEDL